MKINLYYDDDNGETEVEADVDLGAYLEDYLRCSYCSVKEAVEDVYQDDDDEGKEIALNCKDFHELAETLNTQHSDWVDDLISNDEEYMNDLRHDRLYDDYRTMADSQIYEERHQGCDPDGFFNKADYYHWKND